MPGRGWIVENLCADSGYVGKEAESLMRGAGYIAHVVPRGEERKLKDAAWAVQKESGDVAQGYRARRWVVEVSHRWFNLFRKLTIRYEKKAKNWLALHQFSGLCDFTLPDGTNFIYG